MVPTTVLLVDNDHEVRECMREIFECSGYTVQLAHSVEEAMVKVRHDSSENTADVIVLGYRFSHSDPAFSLSSLQRDLEDAGKNISVLVLSTFSVSVPHTVGGPRQAHACLLRSVAKMLTMVKGLTLQKHKHAVGLSHAAHLN